MQAQQAMRNALQQPVTTLGKAHGHRCNLCYSLPDTGDLGARLSGCNVTSSSLGVPMLRYRRIELLLDCIALAFNTSTRRRPSLECRALTQPCPPMRSITSTLQPLPPTSRTHQRASYGLDCEHHQALDHAGIGPKIGPNRVSACTIACNLMCLQCGRHRFCGSAQLDSTNRACWKGKGNMRITAQSPAHVAVDLPKGTHEGGGGEKKPHPAHSRHPPPHSRPSIQMFVLHRHTQEHRCSLNTSGSSKSTG